MGSRSRRRPAARSASPRTASPPTARPHGHRQGRARDPARRHLQLGPADGIHLTGLKPTGAQRPQDHRRHRRAGRRQDLLEDRPAGRAPAQFGGPTSDEPIVVTPGKATAAASEPLHFSVRDAKIGPIGLDHLDVAFDGEDLWTISAGVKLPAADPVHDRRRRRHPRRRLRARRRRRSPSLRPGIGPLGPVFLQRIAFRVELKPKQSKCVPKTGIETLNQRQLLHDITGRWFDVPNLHIDHGIPTFALCGEVGLTAGPTVLGAAAIRLDAGLGLATYDDRPRSSARSATSSSSRSRSPRPTSRSTPTATPACTRVRLGHRRPRHAQGRPAVRDAGAEVQRHGPRRRLPGVRRLVRRARRRSCPPRASRCA